MKALTTKQRWIAISMFAAFAALVTFTFTREPFGYFSVCDRCGALRRTTDWKLPLTWLTAFERSTELDSPLSRVLLTNGIIRPHDHHWLFGQGGGNRVRCAIGPGRHVEPAAASQKFANLVLMLHTHGQTAFRDRLLRGVLDPETSHSFYYLSFSAPEAGASENDLRTWITQESEYLDEMVPASKKR